MPLGRICGAVLLPVLLVYAQPPKALPAGVALTVQLETTLDSEDSEEGDLVVATVIKDAVHKGKVVVPAKATLRGRFRGMDRKPNQTAVGIQFTELEVAGTKIRVVLELEKIVSHLPRLTRQEGGVLKGRPIVRPDAPVIIVNEPRGTGLFVVLSEQFKLVHLQMVWRTLQME